MALEVMFSVLGMIFEPYAIGNLPILLGAVSDRKREVQLAAQDAAKAMMKNLSEHGVKQVLPKLIPSLQRESGRRRWHPSKCWEQWHTLLRKHCPRHFRNLYLI